MLVAKFNISKSALTAALIIAAAGLVWFGYSYYNLNQTFNLTKENLATTTSALAKSQEENDLLAQNLEAEKEKNALFAGQIREISGTVSQLDKLAKTDKELLQKYSKIYFLNENYVPENLSSIPPDYLYEKERQIKFHANAYSYLQEMIVAAKEAGVELKIISAYRSFGEQSSLKTGYTVTYGSGANTFSADQGYSEHQLGTAVDFTTPETGTSFSKFKDTAAYSWLLENAYKYGFTLSYPENNSYYQFEPWHWRFVGKNLAKRLHEDGQYFYNLDQRTIDLYLLSIFG